MDDTEKKSNEELIQLIRSREVTEVRAGLTEKAMEVYNKRLDALAYVVYSKDHRGEVREDVHQVAFLGIRYKGETAEELAQQRIFYAGAMSAIINKGVDEGWLADGIMVPVFRLDIGIINSKELNEAMLCYIGSPDADPDRLNEKYAYLGFKVALREGELPHLAPEQEKK